jgi:trimethylamine:corrinoid methyltransferase-like protein
VAGGGDIGANVETRHRAEPGAIEIGMMNSAVCQMARFYNVPSGGYLGLTNSKISDAQAGFEKGMSPLMGALSGVDFIVMGGLLDALMSFDFAQATIDNEIALMIKRVREGSRAHAQRHLYARTGRSQAARTMAAGRFLDHPSASTEQGFRYSVLDQPGGA